MTDNEAILLAACISAVTSLVVWLLTLRFGPNYRKQIKELADTLATLLERQSSTSELLQQRLDTEGSASWQLSARVEDTKAEAFLILKSHHEFRLHRVTLQAPSGVVLYELPRSPDWDKLQSAGYRIPIPKQALVEFWNNSPGPRVGWATASIGYEVSAGNRQRAFSLPVMLKQDVHTEGASTIVWIRVTG